MRNRRNVALLGLVALLVACGDSPTEPDLTVDGVWEGEGQTSDGDIFTLRLTLIESTDGVVSGSGSLGIPDIAFSLALTVKSGAHSFPDVSVTLGATGFTDMVYEGVVGTVTISGRLNGSGFSDTVVLLERQ